MTQKPPSSPPEVMDHDLARAIQLAVETEALFGIDDLPRGERVPWEPSERVAPAAVPDSALLPAACEEVAAQPASRTLESVARSIAACQACELSQSRTCPVPGQGHARARLMFVGEAPGADEDASGLAFVGRAGQLLTKMIEAMGLKREDVFIANILKCRPPGNRDPKPDEVQACFHFLLDQIDLIQPEIICAMGSHAANNLLERSEPIGRLRGRIFDFQGTPLLPTYHPAYLLRTPSAKRAAWEDLQQIMGFLGLTPGR